MRAIRVKTTIDTAKAGEIAARGVSSGLEAAADAAPLPIIMLRSS